MEDREDMNNDDINIDELLEDFDDDIDESDKKYEELLNKVVESQKKLASKTAEMEARLERERIVDAFMKDADEETAALASTLIDGVEDPKKVKTLLNLAKEKASHLKQEPTEEQQEEEEVKDAFTPPVGVAPPEVKDPMAEVAKRTRTGSVAAAAAEFLLASASRADADIAKELLKKVQ